uniref:SREBP regulating gene protein n=1 Tax=Eubosmina coregoni TaxID=186181 RepID=A0A4Y7LLZ6_9CRUS|nr:EOG090X0AGU [Eubosmina coregoni]SVE69960.1 EOG090X0AGU [Eubosmina coregoni]
MGGRGLLVKKLSSTNHQRRFKKEFLKELAIFLLLKLITGHITIGTTLILQKEKGIDIAFLQSLIFQHQYEDTNILRPLGHVFWQGAEDNNDTKTKPTSCRNSVQGKALIADDKGFVCNRQNMLPNGCCKPDTEGTKHFSCETCHNNGCCSIYEYCISCCLQPDKKEVLQDVLGKAAGTLNLLLASVTDHFELCLTKCRTSSQSVQHENSYRNPRAKHCYGEQPPPLETEGTVEVR